MSGKGGKYLFNPELLQFEWVRPSFKRTLKRVFTLLATSFLVAALYYFAYSVFFDTPAERARKREKAKLEQQLQVLNERYEQLDKVIDNLSSRDSNIYRSLFEANPPSSTVINKTENPIGLEHYSEPKLSQYTANKIVPLDGQFEKNDSLLKQIFITSSASKDRLRFIPAIQPVDNENLILAGASVGMRINPFVKTLKMHTGMDFTLPVGANIYATADGTVGQTTYSLKGSGNTIHINHGTYETRYLYLSDIFVKKGQSVKRGQIIGKVGNIGMGSPHLHYEVLKDGKFADPLHYFFLELNPAQYQRIIEISSQSGQSLD